MIIDNILEKVGLKYDDLDTIGHAGEKEELNRMLTSLSQNQLTIEKVKTYISSMKFSVEQQLVDEPEFNYIFIFKVLNRKQIYLKARLRNYMLLEAFLSTPEKAKEALDRAIAGLVSNKK